MKTPSPLSLFYPHAAYAIPAQAQAISLTNLVFTNLFEKKKHPVKERTHLRKNKEDDEQ